MTSQSHMNQGPEDEREQEARKIVQICAIPASKAECLLYSLSIAMDEFRSFLLKTAPFGKTSHRCRNHNHGKA